jgi:hypothetical protein
MTRVFTLAATLLLALLSFSIAQNPSASPQDSSAGQTSASSQIPSGAVIVSELTKSVDAKKSKPGDKIEARVTMDVLAHGSVVVPRDTKIIGHVTETKARTKDSPDSMIGITFDQVRWKDGHELPLQAIVQAIGGPLSAAIGAGNDSLSENPVGLPGAGSGGVGRTGAGYPSGPANVPGGRGLPGGSETSASATPLGPESRGVVGLRGLSLSGSVQGATISSDNRTVHLDNGTQLVLRVGSQ